MTTTQLTQLLGYPRARLLGVVLVALIAPRAYAQSDAASYPPISHDEPLAERFSFSRAVDYLDGAALDWQQRKRCVTCHTNGLYLAARAELAEPGVVHDQVRTFTRDYLKRYITDGEPPKGDHGAIQGIVSATALLAMNDVKISGGLDSMTREAFDYVWEKQNNDGYWDGWLKCNWPPFEVDDHYGVTLVAHAVGMAPESYMQTPAVQEGLGRLRTYLKSHPPENLHQSAMLLLASTTCDDIMTTEQQQEKIAALFSKQKGDGGWNLATLGSWQRSDGNEQDRESSDGYATGFVTYVLRQAGIAADDSRIQRAIAWLKANQRTSGRWYTRSPRRDGKHYISNAGTAYAVMALAACGQSLQTVEVTE